MRNTSSLVLSFRLFSILILSGVSLFLNSSCELKTDVEAQIREDFPKGKIVVEYKVAAGSAQISGTWPESCVGVQPLEACCEVKVTGTVGGQAINKTYQSCVKVTCTPGSTYKAEIDCADPLALQFPLNCFNFRATQTLGGNSAPIPLTEGIQTLSTTQGDVVAEFGQQIIVLGWSPDAPDGDHSVEINWDMTSSTPIDIKAIAGGLIKDYTVGGNQVFRDEFCPLVPCPSDFSQLPSVTIPVSDSLTTVPLPLDNIGACDILLPAWTCGGSWNLYGSGCAGSGGYVPSLRLNGCPTPGGSFGWQVRDTLGGASGYVVVTTNGPAALPYAGCKLLISPVGMKLFPFTADGIPGAHGAGLARVPLSLPGTPGLFGLKVNCQAAVIDPGAAHTYAFSEGLELIIN